jgi:enterochelin esterase family protein
MRKRLKGTLETPWIDSKVLQGNLPGDDVERMLPVYLPPGYHDGGARYPVIHWLAGHGGSGPLMLNSPAWAESFPERVDRLITTGKMQPAIVVLPDCWTIFGGAQYLNSSALGQYEDYLIDELVPYVDANYRTLPGREHRGVSGKSSGGYGAMVQAMRHPETFGAFATHSGDIYFEFGLIPDLAKLHANLMKLGGVEDFIEKIPTMKPKGHDPFFSVLGMLCYGAAYAPNPKAPRGFDMPIDVETGCLDEAVWARWLEWDPLRMIDRPEYIEAWRSMKYIYVDCGLWDELNFQTGTRRLSQKLDAAGIKHDFELFNDGHIDVPYRNDVSLPRLSAALQE